jgi:hypothetical protein
MMRFTRAEPPPGAQLSEPAGARLDPDQFTAFWCRYFHAGCRHAPGLTQRNRPVQ